MRKQHKIHEADSASVPSTGMRGPFLPRLMKTAVIILLLPAMGMVAMIGILIFAEMSEHNRILKQNVAQFQALEHPEGTQVVSANHAIGLFVGNGNHCDYFVGEMRRFAGEPQAVTEFYATQKFDGRPLHVAIVENGLFAQENLSMIPRKFHTLQSWRAAFTSTTDRLYLVYILRIGTEPAFDIRCF